MEWQNIWFSHRKKDVFSPERLLKFNSRITKDMSSGISGIAKGMALFRFTKAYFEY